MAAAAVPLAVCTVDQMYNPLREDVVAFLAKEFYGKDYMTKLINVLPVPPLTTTIRVNTLRGTRDEVIEVLKKLLYPRYSVEPCTDPGLPDLVLVTSSSPRSVVSPGNPEVLVDTACAEAVLRGAEIFTPGIVGAESGINTNHKVSVMADVDGVCKKGETQKFCGRKFFVGNGVSLMGRSFFYTTPSGVAIQMIERLYDLPPLNNVLRGVMFLQNLPSLSVAHVLSPIPGSSVLDMCAAPGGKTTHIAALMNNVGSICAIDKTPRKVQQLQTQCELMGATCVKTFAFDSTKLLRDGSIDSSTDSPPFAPCSFDFVLLDPPCSGIGLRPCLRESMSVSNLVGHCRYQRKLLHPAVALLKPGGTFVYSTCTVNPQEGEQVIRYLLRHYVFIEYRHILDSYPYMKLVAQPEFMLRISGPGVVGSSLSEEERGLVRRFDPCGDYDTPAFFVAKMIKRV